MSNDSPRSDLAVAICTMNNMRTIGRTLETVRSLASRIVIVDSGSTDGTGEFCRDHGTEVIHQAWLGMTKQRQFSLDQVKQHQWVLLLDSDESLEPDLQQSIRQVISDPNPTHDGWHLRRKTWFLGGWLHHLYQPEWRMRLVRPKTARVAGTPPHDRIEVDGTSGRLTGILRHDSWADVSDLAHRQFRHAREYAEAAQHGGTMWHLLVNPPAAMLKQLVFKRGLLDGWRGVIAAGMTANFTMLKHALIAERRRANTVQHDQSVSAIRERSGA